jgi:hypothetical protein
MSENTELNLSDELKNLIDEYLTGAIEDDGVKRLDELLRADADARLYFVKYCRLHTDIYEVARASRATTSALKSLEMLDEKVEKPPIVVAVPSQKSVVSRTWIPLSVAAAVALVALAGVLHTSSKNGSAEHPIAWVMNAQNCVWKEELSPSNDMRAGKRLVLERGLVEISFESGASLVLEGPANLELISSNSARLLRGKLSAKVPKRATGFSVISPQGKVIDIGTEFGMSVDAEGITDVYVFKGEVKALAGAEKDSVSLKEKQAARIQTDGVSVKPVEEKKQPVEFVRQIAPPPVIVPRRIELNFDKVVAGSLPDSEGAATGLTHRLAGTGSKLLQHDSNLKLNIEKKQLELTTTNSDINHQFLLDQGEYIGFRLADMGFSGDEDFAITVTIPEVPALNRVGQFGLYAGTNSAKNIRGGLISSGETGSYKLFLANNNGGKDSNAHFVGLHNSGDDLRLTLRREAGKYSLTSENLTTGSASTVSIKNPDFLDSQSDMYVGLFGANTQSEVRRTLIIKQISVTVWTRTPASAPVAAR